MSKLSDYQIKRTIGKSQLLQISSSSSMCAGKGTYCSVSLVIHKADNKKYALKVVKFLDSTSEREKDNALAEVRYLASVQHPNVIAYKAAFIDEPSSCLW